MKEEKLRWCPRCQKQVAAMHSVCKDCGAFVATKTHVGKVPILSICGVVIATVGPLAVYGGCGNDREFRLYGMLFVFWPSIILGIILLLWGLTVKKQ